MEESRASSVSKASTLKEMGEFWDAHDFTEYDDMDLPDVEFEVLATVAIEKIVALPP